MKMYKQDEGLAEGDDFQLSPEVQAELVLYGKRQQGMCMQESLRNQRKVTYANGHHAGNSPWAERYVREYKELEFPDAGPSKRLLGMTVTVLKLYRLSCLLLKSQQSNNA